MTRTGLITAPYDDSGIAQKYGEGKRLPFYDMDFHAGGSAWASAHDLVRFGMFHLRDHLPDQKPILSRQLKSAFTLCRLIVLGIRPGSMHRLRHRRAFEATIKMSERDGFTLPCSTVRDASRIALRRPAASARRPVDGRSGTGS
jgi:hypothetical protein